MLKYAKANPGKLNYSSAGIGTLPHVTMELLLRRADVRVTHVAYKGARAGTDLLAGVVQLKYDTYAISAQHLAAGKLKVLATAEATRLPQLPDVPTVAESGFPGYEGYLDRCDRAGQDAGGGDRDAVRGVREGGPPRRSPNACARTASKWSAARPRRSAGSSPTSSSSGRASCATRRSPCPSDRCRRW